MSVGDLREGISFKSGGQMVHVDIVMLHLFPCISIEGSIDADAKGNHHGQRAEPLRNPFEALEEAQNGQQKKRRCHDDRRHHDAAKDIGKIQRIGAQVIVAQSVPEKKLRRPATCRRAQKAVHIEMLPPEKQRRQGAIDKPEGGKNG